MLGDHSETLIQIFNVETSFTSFKIKGSYLFGINTDSGGISDNTIKMVSLQSGKLYAPFTAHSNN